MLTAKQRLNDWMLAGVVTVAGSASLSFALLHHWIPGDMSAGVDGSLTVGVLAPALARLEGLSYRATVLLTLVILAMQFVAFQAVRVPALGVLGLELIATGLIGAGGALSAAASAPRRAKAPGRRPTSDAPVGASGSPYPAHF
jgi:hypothetical protein